MRIGSSAVSTWQALVCEYWAQLCECSSSSARITFLRELANDLSQSDCHDERACIEQCFAKTTSYGRGMACMLR